MKVLFRRVNASAKSVQDTVEMLLSLDGSQVISTSGSNVLALVDDSSVRRLEEQLPGWVVSPQTVRTPIPDTRLKIRSSAG